MRRRIAIAADFKEAREARCLMLEEVARCGYSGEAVFAIQLALEEALNNAIKHGSRGDPDKQITIAFDIDKRRASITIADCGDGFDLDAVPDPTADENLEKPTGRGVMLMQAYMDKVQFNHKGNEVRMVKRNR